jgi:L-ascorbate metabolism protein UlaG (beta-lactamase superfamily)
MKRVSSQPWAALALSLLAASSAMAAPVAEPACQSLTPAIVGGPVPGPRSDTMLIRWLGTSNYELSWKGKTFLFDTYFDRPGRTRSVGFKVPDVKRADVIFLGHGHADHIADIAPVAKQTGALVVGAPSAIEAAIRMGVPQTQTRVVNGGETLTFGDVRVETALARHSTIQAGLFDAYRQLYAVDGLGPLTPAEAAQAAEVAKRGSSSPDLIEKGVIAYGLVLPSGFSVVTLDTAGPVTEGDRALASRLGRADVAILAYQPHAVAERQLQDSWPLIELFNPKLYLPSHHDHIWGAWLDLGLEPLFQKIRDERPQTGFIAPLLRSAICIGTMGAARGSLKVRY